MKVLHICNDFVFTKLYYELFNKIAIGHVEQTIVAPYIDKQQIQNDNFDVIYYKKTFNIFLRFFFRKKIKKAIKIIKAHFFLNNNIVIHAHTLFSDGAIALFLSKEFGLRYVVAVRNTDVNIFFKYFIWLRQLGYKILDNASCIVFISESYKIEVTERILPEEYKNRIKSKCLLIPNGINDFWLKNRNFKNELGKRIKLLYVGEITNNKNIHSIILALDIINKISPFIDFTIIGKGLNDQNKYLSDLEKMISNRNNIYLENKIDKNELINKFRENDIFIMTSHKETFGLVYAEALSQGLPIVYTRGQGFDGFYSDGYVGYSVDSKNINSISQGIINIINNYKKLCENIKNEDLNIFNWENISKKYIEIYEELK